MIDEREYDIYEQEKYDIETETMDTIICEICGDFVEYVDAIANQCIECQHANGIDE